MQSKIFALVRRNMCYVNAHRHLPKGSLLVLVSKSLEQLDVLIPTGRHAVQNVRQEHNVANLLLSTAIQHLLTCQLYMGESVVMVTVYSEHEGCKKLGAL